MAISESIALRELSIFAMVSCSIVLYVDIVVVAVVVLACLFVYARRLRRGAFPIDVVSRSRDVPALEVDCLALS